MATYHVSANYPPISNHTQAQTKGPDTPRPSGLSPFALATTPSLTVFGSPVIPTASAPRHNQLSVRTSSQNKNRNKPLKHSKQNKQAGTGEGMKLLGVLEQCSSRVSRRDVSVLRLLACLTLLLHSCHMVQHLLKILTASSLLQYPPACSA